MLYTLLFIKTCFFLRLNILISQATWASNCYWEVLIFFIASFYLSLWISNFKWHILNLCYFKHILLWIWNFKCCFLDYCANFWKESGRVSGNNARNICSPINNLEFIPGLYNWTMTTVGFSKTWNCLSCNLFPDNVIEQWKLWVCQKDGIFQHVIYSRIM